MTNPLIQTLISDLEELKDDAKSTVGSVPVNSQQLLVITDLALYLLKRLPSEEILRYLKTR